MANLTEKKNAPYGKYTERIKLAEQLYAKRNGGATLSQEKKFILANTLKNQAKFFNSKLNEAFDNSVSLQRSDVGNFKIFCQDITTAVLPNLILTDLMIVFPMTSTTGSLTYWEYVKGSNKGASKIGDLIDNPFKLGNVDPTYTSAEVVENDTLANSKLALQWGPVVPGSIAFTVGADKYFDDGAGKVYKGVFASKRYVQVQEVEEDGVARLEGVAGHYVVDAGSAVEVGKVTYGSPKSKSATGAIYDGATPEITFTTAPVTENPIEVHYLYNNIAILQNDIPTLTAVRKAITLEVKWREIRIEYSGIAAFVEHAQFGDNLGDNLGVRAVSQLKYEIDSEGIDFLVANATVDPEVTFNFTDRVGVSAKQQAEGFITTLNIAREKMYTATQKYAPNYMVCAYSVLQVLNYLDGFTAAPFKNNIAGPFFAGTYQDLKIYVSPRMARDKFVLGLHDGEFNTSAAVYGTFMAIMPTQLLQLPDFTNVQGFATGYDLKLLNKCLLIAGTITRNPDTVTLVGQQGN